MGAFEYRQALEIRDCFARHGVRYLFLGKSGAILLGFPDTTQDAHLFVEKRRLENGELDGVHPKIIIILAGINNVGTEPAGNEKTTYIAAGLKTILGVCQQKAPAATIIVTAIFPRNDSMAVIPVIHEANRKIAELADGKKIRFLDINRKLAEENGKFFEGMVNTDNLHPTVKTYQVWADALKPIFTEILGPPALTDHAPPPTGDPGATKK